MNPVIQNICAEDLKQMLHWDTRNDYSSCRHQNAVMVCNGDLGGLQHYPRQGEVHLLDPRHPTSTSSTGRRSPQVYCSVSFSARPVERGLTHSGAAPCLM